MSRQKSGLILLGQSLDGFLLFGLEQLFTVLVCFLGLRSVGLSPVSQKLLDVLHENPLICKHVILRFRVQAVIGGAVNLWRRILILLIQVTFSGIPA